MAAASLTLRVQSKTGRHVLKDISAQSSLGDLLSQISNATQITTDAIKIMHGFPPKAMDITNPTMSLGDLKFRSGDTLIVEEDSKVRLEKEAKVQEELQEAIASQIQNHVILMRQVVPANNSCLFTSVHYVMEGGRLDLNAARPMRELIAGVVMSDPVTYDEAFLGKTNTDYCAWIMNDESWGGAIEVSILSKYYGIEIAVVDTQYCRINKFGEDQNYRERVLLIYDGIHYDPLSCEAGDPSAPSRTKFSTSDDSILSQALELAAECKASRQYTDVHKFTLRCLECQKALTGQTEAQEHAKITGHINFGEY